MTKRLRQKQATMAETFIRKTRQEVEADAQEQNAVPMQVVEAPASAPCFEEVQCRVETLEEQHLTSYRRYITLTKLEKEELKQDNAVDRSNWCQEGSKYVEGLQDLMSCMIAFPSVVTRALAMIVKNHHEHELEPGLSDRAACLLDAIASLQPPAIVRAPRKGEGRPVLVVQDPAYEVWAGLPLCTVDEGRILARRHTARAAGPPAASSTDPPKYGLRWLAQQLGAAYEATMKAGRPMLSIFEIRQFHGALLLAEFFLRMWEDDLKARLEVVQAHATDRKQRKYSQLMLTSSIAFRAIDQSPVAERENVLTVIWNILLASSNQQEDESEEQVAFRVKLCGVAAALQRCIFALAGALEEAGMSCERGAVAPHTTRQTLDHWLYMRLGKCRDRVEWDAILNELPFRDRLRFIAMFVGNKYKHMGFSDNKAKEHHGLALMQIADRLGGESPREQAATFVDVPPSMVIHLLTHKYILRRFYETVFFRVGDVLAAALYHLAIAAAFTTAELLKEGRLITAKQKDGSPKQLACPPGSLDRPFADTWAHMDSALSLENQAVVANEEIKSVRAGVECVREFLQSISSKKQELDGGNCATGVSPDNGVHLALRTLSLANTALTCEPCNVF